MQTLYHWGGPKCMTCVSSVSDFAGTFISPTLGTLTVASSTLGGSGVLACLGGC